MPKFLELRITSICRNVQIFKRIVLQASAQLSDIEKAIMYTAELLATDHETAEMCLRDANVTVGKKRYLLNNFVFY